MKINRRRNNRNGLGINGVMAAYRRRPVGEWPAAVSKGGRHGGGNISKTGVASEKQYVA